MFQFYAPNQKLETNVFKKLSDYSTIGIISHFIIHVHISIKIEINNKNKKVTRSA